MTRLQMFSLIVFLLILFFSVHAIVGCSRLLKNRFITTESDKITEETVNDVTEEELEQGIHK